jgi:coenzyme F420-reducing hydrogenase delta subunit
MGMAEESGVWDERCAACGVQCARENIAFWVHQRVEKVRKTLVEIGLESERLQAFILPTKEDATTELDQFAEQIGGLHLASVIMREVKS